MNNLPSNASACLTSVNRDAKSFAEVLMGQDSRFPGKVADYPAPILPPHVPSAFALIPQSWIDESEENLVFSADLNHLIQYYSHGVATASFSDQVNSLSQSQRDAALMAHFLDEDDLWSNIFPKLYDISDKTKFPPVFAANHAGAFLTGPLKEDWTKVCPYEWTIEEREEKCISSQEAIYGTELLKRLEAIKIAVDPNFMLNCHNCIGNNLDLAKASHTQDDESVSPSTATATAKPSDEPSSASFVSLFYAAAISAIGLSLFLPILN